MILDTSAIMAVLRQEPEAEEFADAIEKAEVVKISAVTWVEAAAAVESARDPVASRKFDAFIETARCRIEPVTERQAQIARLAYRDFGRGSGHPVRLNFGDCFSYALAKESGEPLLFKGKDFTATDLG